MLKKYLPLIIAVVVFFMFKDKILAMIKPKTDPVLPVAEVADIDENDTTIS